MIQLLYISLYPTPFFFNEAYTVVHFLQWEKVSEEEQQDQELGSAKPDTAEYNSCYIICVFSIEVILSSHRVLSAGCFQYTLKAWKVAVKKTHATAPTNFAFVYHFAKDQNTESVLHAPGRHAWLSFAHFPLRSILVLAWRSPEIITAKRKTTLMHELRDLHQLIFKK